MKRFLCCSTLIFVASASFAETYECNAHGAVVTQEDGTVFYLGKNCDAAIKGGGTGHWVNAASFRAVVIGEDWQNSQSYQVFSEIPCLGFCQPPDDF